MEACTAALARLDPQACPGLRVCFLQLQAQALLARGLYAEALDPLGAALQLEPQSVEILLLKSKVWNPGTAPSPQFGQLC